MAAVTRTRVAGTVAVPGDKSISHRALILAALAEGTSRITGILDSADVRSTARVLRGLGAAVPELSAALTITGRPARGLRSPMEPLDCGNSGTTTRLMAGVVAGAGLTATFVGDASLSRRPMGRVSEPLRAMGARVSLPAHGGLPMTVTGDRLRAIEWDSPVASAQVKSAILLASLVAGVQARVREPALSRDHTERMLAHRGVRLERRGDTIVLDAGQTLRAADVHVPGDPSSAAYFLALGCLADAGELRVRDVCLNPTRTGFLEALRRMGADVAIENAREVGGEPVGTVVTRPRALHGIDVPEADVPAMIDELPLLACVAARARGTTTVRGAAELRVKESDRIAVVVDNLRRLGAEAEELPDGFRVSGGDQPLRGRITTAGDHRMAMSFGVLGVLDAHTIEIDEPACVDVSYPGFWRDLEQSVR